MSSAQVLKAPSEPGKALSDQDSSLKTDSDLKKVSRPSENPFSIDKLLHVEGIKTKSWNVKNDSNFASMQICSFPRSVLVPQNFLSAELGRSCFAKNTISSSDPETGNNDSSTSPNKITETPDEGESKDLDLEFDNNLTLDVPASQDLEHLQEADKRKKRPRTAFTAAQIKCLETEFEKNKYLSVAKRLQLSKSLKLTETQVKAFWFESPKREATLTLLVREFLCSGNFQRELDVNASKRKMIKIWFQNRRTKWKRKYTNDLEILAQQYYSSMGALAPRPIFLGDRLWLFNCQTGLYQHPLPSLTTDLRSVNCTQLRTFPETGTIFRPYPHRNECSLRFSQRQESSHCTNDGHLPYYSSQLRSYGEAVESRDLSRPC